MKFVIEGDWLTWEMPEEACPCLDHGCLGAERCNCYCHDTARVDGLSDDKEARERTHICQPPISGYNQDGQRWECPGCGAVYEWFEDEAEGGFWENVVDVEEA